MPAGRSVHPRPSIAFSTLPCLFEYQAKRIPKAPAILAPGREPLTYGHLFQRIQKTGGTLRAMGIGLHDRVAVVLPNGPETAVAILSVAAYATCVPMNPALGTDELDRYFADLRPRALIAQAGIDSPARRVALSRGVLVLNISSELDAKAGLFTLAEDQEGTSPDDAVSPSDVGLLLLTSGTTAQPKFVPLTHANICASACSTVRALALTETDRCINMLPLFHGHGLNNMVLGSLTAGASVVCTPGCEVKSFFAWLTDFQPTWYSAVPTMHQAILAHSRDVGERGANYRLRFVRSSSAPLPPHVFAELERTFEAPVIEFYGLTETSSSPIAANPLPPCKRKLGSVGIPVDLQVAIMDERGTLLPHGKTGQIVCRGASVVAGYDGDPVATEAAFAGNWLKTGDLGYFDDDGYLFLAGRIREIINRGGEKIAPQEVDDVLLQHPAVTAALTFAVPHATLGEDVASAVVLRSDRKATPKEIRQFAIGRIADFKIPHRVLIVKEIPRGPTGKVRRIGLAAELGLTTSPALPEKFVAPRTPLEKALARCWAEILKLERICIHDNFFASGGDSLLAVRVLCHIFEITQIEFDVSRFFKSPTIAEVAEHLRALARSGQARRAPAIARSPRQQERAPTSIAQERLWELQRALPDVPLFNILYMLRLTSPVDVKVLERSINEVVKRHEMLRTTFDVVEGRLVQVIAPRLTVPLGLEKLHKLTGSNRQSVIRRLVQKELRHSFNLARGPLIRARLLCLAERRHLLLISMAGIIQDGWSLGVFIEELATLYDAFSAGRASPLKPLPVQYADFAYWQRGWRSYPDIVAQLAYWREQLHEPLPVMKLAELCPGRATEDFLTARRKVALPAKLAKAAQRFSQREGVTLFMTLIAAFKTLLHHYVGQDDLRVATLVANRNRPQTERLIGPLVNTVILRTSFAGNPSSREAMRRVRATTLAAFANQDIPLEEVVAALERERALERASLAQFMIWLQNAPLRPIVSAEHGLAFEELDPSMLFPLATVTTFDVMLMLRESPQGLVGTCLYKPRLFRARTIDRLLQDFRQVLDQMIRHPERRISEISVSLNEKQ
jgi:acyl-CoA synthetase (AMP-forming)/AMP-acid ligase II